MIDASKIFAALPEYPIDQIFYYTSGSQVTPDSIVVTNTSVAHGQGKLFFWKMRFSEDQANWYQEGFPPYAYNVTFNLYIPTFYAKLYITTTNLNFTFASIGAARTIYWQLVGYSLE